MKVKWGCGDAGKMLFRPRLKGLIKAWLCVATKLEPRSRIPISIMISTHNLVHIYNTARNSTTFQTTTLLATDLLQWLEMAILLQLED